MRSAWRNGMPVFLTKLKIMPIIGRLKRPQSFVAKYEGGERRLDVIEFLTIAKAIGADPLRLIKRLIR